MTEVRKSWQGTVSLAAAVALSFGIAFGSIWSDLPVGTRTWNVCNMVSAMTQWAMPAMAVLVGSIFLSSKRRLSLETLWKRYIPLTVISCLVWWLAASVVWLQENYPQDQDFLTFRECMARTLEMPANIGFCHMLVSFFIMYPLMHRIAGNKKVLGYTIVLFLMMSLVEPVFQNIPYLSLISMFTSQLNWGFYRAWTFYLLCGVWITTSEIDWKFAIGLYSLGILATGAMIALTFRMTTFSPGYANEYIGYTSPLTGIQTVAVVTLLKRLLNNWHALRFTRLTKNMWFCVPVLYIASFFSERIVSRMTDSLICASVYSALLGTAFAFAVISMVGVLPGIRCLICDYQRKGDLFE